MNLAERLRQPVMLHSNPEQTNAERREAADEIERLSETIRAFGRGDIVSITDKDAEIELLRAVMADALRIMELVPSAAQDHRPIEDVRKEMRALLASRAEQKADGT